MKSEIFMGNGIPLACSKLGGVPRIFILFLSFMVKFSVVSCLGKLSYEIGVCIEVYHSFVESLVSVSVQYLWWNINEKSIGFFAALGIFLTQSILYANSYGSIDLTYQVWLWKLYLILANIALVITTIMSFSSSDIAKTFMFLCLKCYADKEDNLMFYANSLCYTLYCFASKSTLFVSS